VEVKLRVRKHGRKNSPQIRGAPGIDNGEVAHKKMIGMIQDYNNISRVSP